MSDNKIWYFECDVVTLRGARMTVEAETKEEAIAKAQADNWVDITYDEAELTDWHVNLNSCEADDYEETEK